MKKFLSIILTILMVVTMLPMSVLPASAAENLDYNIKLEVVDWAVYDTSDELIGEFNAVEHGDAFYDVSLTQADDGTFTCSYQIALERNDGNTAWDESSISFKIDSCKDEFLQEFEKSCYSNYNIFYNLKVTRTAGHSFSDWTDAGDGTHTRICSVCSETETQNHSFEGGNCLTVGKCVCGLSSIDSNVHTKPVKYVVNSENNFKHDEVYECCGVIKSNLDHKYDSKGMCKECKYQCAHSSFTDSICDSCGYNSAFVVIDGTLGGKTTATEDDVNTLVEQLKGYVDSGITTIIVTGSEPALHNFYGIDTSAVSAALYYLADGRSDSPYCGTIDLILPDVTEIVDDEFNNTFALNSITLPKVTTVGDGAFYGTAFLQTLTFGSVITFVSEKNSGPFHMDGYKVGGCDLVLNCGQLQAEDKYKPNFETNVWFIGDWSGEYEWKSITLTHIGGEATCVAKAVCETCGEEYGDIDANAHSYSDVHSNGDGTHSFTCTACHITGIENHTGGTATCSKQAVCEVCGESYGELDPDNHASDTYTYTDNGDGTHDATYSCCGAAVAEVPHTLDVTTGKCSACGADMTAIATVTDGTNTYYAADVATLNQAVTAILETGSRTFTVELPADTEAEMITAIRRAICDTEGVADGSINLTLKGVISIPGTTNWDGVAFGPRNAQWDENNVEIVSHEEVTQLASVNLPDATEIGAQAFYFCENLVTVSAPKAQTIGAQAFGYTALTSVEFPELTTIPTDMFSGTWTLSSAKFPKVTTIEQGGLLVGAKFKPENNPTPFPLELTAEGDITFIGSNHFNIASQNYSGKVDLVLNIDKKEQVTFNDDGTATWQVRDDLSYTFKSITFTCTDGTTNHSYTYTDNGDGTHDATCSACGAVVDNDAHTIENHVCTACGAMEIVVSFDAGDYEWKTGDTLYFCRVSRENEWEEYCFTATVAEDGTVTWTPDKTLYWDGTGEHKLVVRYPEWPGLAWDNWGVGADQTTSEKLRGNDLMKAIWSGIPTTDTITLNLKHRLAKVSVNYEIAEDVAATVSKAEIYSLTQYLFFDTNTLDRVDVDWTKDYNLWINSYHTDNQFTAFVSPDAYAADGNFIKITLSDGTVREVKMNKAVTFEEGAEYTYTVVITADGAYLTCADECTFEYTDNEDGTHKATCTVCGYVAASENHTLTYSVDGNTITAYCSANCGYSGTATISATGKTYDGNAVEVVVSKTGSLENTDIPVTLTKDGEAFTGAPVNAGTYTASIGIGENENAVVASVEFIIENANPVIAAAPTPNTLTYIGEAQYLISAGEAVGGTMVYSLTENGEYTTSIPQGTNAGDYTVWYYVQGDANRNDSAKASVSVNIAKATVTVTANDTTITYGEAPINTGVTYSGFVNGEDETVLGGELAYTYTYTQNGNVGDYSITPEGLTADNYEITFVDGTLTVEQIDIGDIIDEMKINLEQYSYVYDGTEKKPKVTSITVDGVTLTEGTDYTVRYEDNVNVGEEATAVITFEGNYDGTFRKWFTITKAYYNLTAPTPNTLTYNGEDQYLVSAGTVEGADFEYSLDGVSWSTSIPQAKDVGNYTVYYRVLADENHYGIEGTVDVTIKECTHEWGEGVLTRPVHDTVLGSKDGYYTYTCTVCGEEKTEAVKSADYSAYEAVSEEINALLQSDELTDAAKQAIYSAANECGLPSNDLTESEQNIVDDLVAELEKIVADAEEKIASGEYVKADYTEIDEAIASVDEALENATISEEMANELSDIKSQLEALKENKNTSMADAAELLERVKAVAETMADCAKGIHSFTKYEEVTAPECGKAGKEVAVCDHGCGATDEKEIPALVHEPRTAVVENEVAAECEKAGSYDLVVYCDICGEELDRDTVTVDALTHTDEDGDYLCDHGCGHEFEKPVEPEQPDTPDTPDEPTDDTCDHICHSNNALIKFLWKIICFFYRLFNIQQYCDCGVIHYDAPVFG